MDFKDIRNLQEAYLEVYASKEDLDEGIGQAISGILFGSKKTKLKPQRKRPPLPPEKDPWSDPATAKSWSKERPSTPTVFKTKTTKVTREDVDIYDIILSHLLDEGYAETPEAAEKIMVHMSEDWRDDIVEGYISPYKGKPSYSNPQGHSPATRAMQKSDELQRTEPGSKRQRMQTRRSQQLNRMFQAARTA